MAIDNQLWDFMPHVVTIQSGTGKNEYGEEEISTSSRKARAYVEPLKVLSNQMTRNEENQPKRVYISDTNITLRDKITLPDGSSPKIHTIERHVEVLGLEHTIVTFL